MDFWRELATLVAIMRLGSQAGEEGDGLVQGALAALTDDADRLPLAARSSRSRSWVCGRGGTGVWPTGSP